MGGVSSRIISLDFCRRRVRSNAVSYTATRQRASTAPDIAFTCRRQLLPNSITAYTDVGSLGISHSGFTTAFIHIPQGSYFGVTTYTIRGIIFVQIQERLTIWSIHGRRNGSTTNFLRGRVTVYMKGTNLLAAIFSRVYCIFIAPVAFLCACSVILQTY